MALFGLFSNIATRFANPAQSIEDMHHNRRNYRLHVNVKMLQITANFAHGQM